MQDPHPDRWHRHHHHHDHRDPFGIKRRGSGEPLRRDTAERLGGGVAAGVAAWRGIGVTKVRIVFALVALVTTGIGVALYVLAWLIIPAQGEETSIASRARTDSAGIRLAVGLASLLIVVLLAAGALSDGWFITWVWPQVFSVAGLTLIWRNASPEEQETLRQLVEPLEAATGPAGTERRTVIRLVVASALLIGGVGWLFSAHESLALLRPLAGVLLVIAAIILFLGPWWLRIARERAGAPGPGPGRGADRHGGPDP